MSGGQPFVPARDHARRSAALPCPACGAFRELDLPRGEPAPEDVPCARCGAAVPLALPSRVDAQGRLSGCPRCGYHTLAIQKDVNPRLGLAVVVVTFGALLLLRPPLPVLLAALVALALLDWLLLRLVVRRFLLCYRCKAQFRGFPPGEGCRPFDLATWEAHDAPP